MKRRWLLLVAALALLVWLLPADHDSVPSVRDEPADAAKLDPSSASAGRDRPRLTALPPVVSSSEPTWADEPVEPGAGLSLRGPRFDFEAFDREHDFLDHVMVAALQEPLDRLQDEGLAGDGEAAYAVFAFLHSCVFLGPISETDVARRERTFVESLMENPDRELHPISGLFLEDSRNHFRQCSAVPRDTLLSEMWDWLTRSADLGYFPGVFHYLMLGSVFGGDLAVAGETYRIDQYRVRAPTFRRQLLETGHPQAFEINSSIEQTGLIARRDLVMAYAYLHAAELADTTTSLDARLDAIGLKLDRAQLREAKAHGLDLCQRYARQGCGG